MSSIPRWWIAKLGNYQIAVRLAKPLFFCAPCMASVWGWIGFRLWVDEPIAWLLYPAWVVVLAGLNLIINKAIN